MENKIIQAGSIVFISKYNTISRASQRDIDTDWEAQDYEIRLATDIEKEFFLKEEEKALNKINFNVLVDSIPNSTDYPEFNTNDWGGLKKTVIKRKLKYLMTFTLINIHSSNNTEYLFQSWNTITDEGGSGDDDELHQTLVNIAIKDVLTRTGFTVKEEHIKFTGIYLLDTVILKD